MKLVINKYRCLNIDDKIVKEFEKHLKTNCFKQFIVNYQNSTGRKTQEWMLGINIDIAEKIIKEEFRKLYTNK